MGDRRIVRDDFTFCNICLPSIIMSLRNSNILVRCDTWHADRSIHKFYLKFNCWVWDNKVKLSNDDRREILRLGCNLLK